MVFFKKTKVEGVSRLILDNNQNEHDMYAPFQEFISKKYQVVGNFEIRDSKGNVHSDTVGFSKMRDGTDKEGYYQGIEEARQYALAQQYGRYQLSAKLIDIEVKFFDIEYKPINVREGELPI